MCEQPPFFKIGTRHFGHFVASPPNGSALPCGRVITFNLCRYCSQERFVWLYRTVAQLPPQSLQLFLQQPSHVYLLPMWKTPSSCLRAAFLPVCAFQPKNSLATIAAQAELDKLSVSELRLCRSCAPRMRQSSTGHGLKTRVKSSTNNWAGEREAIIQASNKMASQAVFAKVFAICSLCMVVDHRKETQRQRCETYRASPCAVGLGQPQAGSLWRATKARSARCLCRWRRARPRATARCTPTSSARKMNQPLEPHRSCLKLVHTRYTQTPVNKSAMKVNLQIEQLHRSCRSGLKFADNVSTLTSSSISDQRATAQTMAKTVELAKLHAASGPHRLQRKLVSSQGQHCQCTTLVALKIQATEQPALEGVDAPGQNEDTYTNTWNKAPG